MHLQYPFPIFLAGLILVALIALDNYSHRKDLAELRAAINTLRDDQRAGDTRGADLRKCQRKLLERTDKQNRELLDAIDELHQYFARYADIDQASLSSQPIDTQASLPSSVMPHPEVLPLDTSETLPQRSRRALGPEAQAIIAEVIDRHTQAAQAQTAFSSSEDDPEKLMKLMQATDIAIRNELKTLLYKEEFEAFFRPMSRVPFGMDFGAGPAEGTR